MKITFFAFALGLLVVLAWGLPVLAAPVEAKIAKEVQPVLDQFAQAMAGKDSRTLMSLVAADPIFYVGVQPEEVVASRAELQAHYDRLFAKDVQLLLQYQIKSLAQRGQTILAGGLLQARVKTPQGERGSSGRFTAALIEQQGRWVIAQYHASLPAPGPSAGQDKPAGK